MTTTKRTGIVRVGQVWRALDADLRVRVDRVELAPCGRLTYVLVSLLDGPTWGRTSMWLTMAELERAFDRESGE